MGDLLRLTERVRDVIDDGGWQGCFQSAVFAYHKKTNLPIPGLWAAVEAVIGGGNPAKVLKKLQKSWGGSPEQWIQWFAIAKRKPNC